VREYAGSRSGGLSNLFGGKTAMAERFAAARWQTGETGCPRLEGALASFDCHINQVVSVGTHDIVLRDSGYRPPPCPEGLVWFNRHYHTLMRPAC
jgi:flavin reductase